MAARETFRWPRALHFCWPRALQLQWPPLGIIAWPPSIYDLCEFATAPEGASLWEFCFEIIARHARGDWGECDHQDWAANDAAVVLGERVVSVYHLPSHSEVFVITEADRQTTTVLLTQEY